MKILSYLIAISFVMLTSCTQDNRLSFEEIAGRSDYGIHEVSNWPDSCNKLKSDYSQIVWMFAKYSEKPKVELNEELWNINWRDIKVPVPKTSYDNIAVSSKENKLDKLYIWNNQIRISVSTSFTYDNEVPLFQDQPNLKNNDVYASMTAFTLQRHSLNVTPDDLACNVKWEVGYPLAATLLYKGLIRPTGTFKRAYNEQGNYFGFTVEVRHEGTITWYVYTVPTINTATSSHMLIRVQENSKYKDLGLYVGENYPVVDKNLPRWLSALNLAIDTHTNDAWMDFLASAEEAGFNKERLMKVSETLNIKGYGPNN